MCAKPKNIDWSFQSRLTWPGPDLIPHNEPELKLILLLTVAPPIVILRVGDIAFTVYYRGRMLLCWVYVIVFFAQPVNRPMTRKFAIYTCHVIVITLAGAGGPKGCYDHALFKWVDGALTCRVYRWWIPITRDTSQHNPRQSVSQSVTEICVIFSSWDSC